MIPRNVAFDLDGKAIVAGCPANLYPESQCKVMFLPSEHYDFIDFDVKGKTEQEIRDSVNLPVPSSTEENQ